MLGTHQPFKCQNDLGPQVFWGSVRQAHCVETRALRRALMNRDTQDDRGVCRCLNLRNRAPHPGSPASPQTLHRWEPTEALSSQGGPPAHKRLRAWKAGAGGKADLGAPNLSRLPSSGLPQIQEALPSLKPRLQTHRLLECIPPSLQLPPLTEDLPLVQLYITGTLRSLSWHLIYHR